MTTGYITIQIRDYDEAQNNFNDELNDMHERDIADSRPYFGSEAMEEFVNELEYAINDNLDFDWEIGKRTRWGHVATFRPSDAWMETYLDMQEA